MDGLLFDLKEFGLHDGPGLRLTVFLKGCPLRCVWCHNPEGIFAEPAVVCNESKCRRCGLCRRGCSHPDCAPYGRCLHICPDDLVRVSGYRMSVAALVRKIQSFAPFFENGGGVTFSGGEPLCQSDFIEQVLAQIGTRGTAVETCSCVPAAVYRKMMPLFETRFCDLKLMDDERHRQYTGASNRQILENLAWLKASGLSFTVRIPLIPGVTDTAENLTAAAEFLADSKNLTRVELLPYNQLTGAKYRAIGQEYCPPFDEKAPLVRDVSAFTARGIDCVAF